MRESKLPKRLLKRGKEEAKLFELRRKQRVKDITTKKNEDLFNKFLKNDDNKRKLKDFIEESVFESIKADIRSLLYKEQILTKIKGVCYVCFDLATEALSAESLNFNLFSQELVRMYPLDKKSFISKGSTGLAPVDKIKPKELNLMRIAEVKFSKGFFGGIKLKLKLY